jgi:hypothetical protein
LGKEDAMSFEFDERWDAAGWVPCVASVDRNRVGHELRHAWRHDNAPGLVVHASLDDSGRLTITHAPSGLDTGLLWAREWTPCPEALRDALAEACAVIDYVTLTVASAPYVPAEKKDRVREITGALVGHACPACEAWHEARLPKQIQEEEEALEEAQQAVQDCEDALADAENEVEGIRRRLRELRAKQAARTTSTA